MTKIRINPFLIAAFCISLIFTNHQVYSQHTESQPDLINWNQSLSDDIDKKVIEYMELSHTPGLALAIIKNGKVVKRSFYGYGNVSKKVPITEESEFWLSSVSKHLTSVLILALEEEGVISNEDLVIKYIPDLPEKWNDIKIKHLMSHTSGIKDIHQPNNPETFLNQLFSYVPEAPTLAEFEAIMNKINIEYPAGENYFYSDIGMLVLSAVASEAADRPFDLLMEEYIFQPAKMSAYIYDPSESRPEQVTGYTYANWELGKDQNRESVLKLNQKAFGGGGSLFVTLDDMINWNHALNENLIIDKSSKELLWKKIELANGRKIDMGLGMIIIEYPGGYAVGHEGISGTHYWKFPEYNIDLVVLTNHGMSFSPNGLTNLIAESLGILDELDPQILLNKMQVNEVIENKEISIIGRYKIKEPFPTELYLDFFEKENKYYVMLQGLVCELIKIKNGRFLGYSDAYFFPKIPFLPQFEIEDDNVKWILGTHKLPLTQINN
ncbi:serine hydrolase domain-containing protein [Mangrovivirga cuniculi]|uniref:Beta-lactamase-related domain-containing protein n=1 Tax=Mangrovivirga cuniculi TaxID=2715131 RepID=A0A4D7JJP9_9BACT|nr:serine hydrolase domain-containing protein [Mangrovivirga cuniculi]QCK15203.1 hypothetical protein DCC35_10810 [Mangrovivirga cuniculi]